MLLLPVCSFQQKTIGIPSGKKDALSMMTSLQLTTVKTQISTWFPQPRKYYSPGQNIQDLKPINQDMCKKAYHIYSMYD